MGVTTAATYAFSVERDPLLSARHGMARTYASRTLTPQGNAELVNECPHGPDIQKQNKLIKGSALMKTIVGMEVL